MLEGSSGVRASVCRARGRTMRAQSAAFCAIALTIASLGIAANASAITLAPVNGGSQVCTDSPLSINFASPPRLGTTGTISVFRNNGALVDSINLADPNSAKRTVGNAMSDAGLAHLWKYSPMIVSGTTATIYLHKQLDYGATYYVTVDPGVLVDAQGFAGIQDPLPWRFMTKTSPPVAGTSQVSVAADGTGDFCTVQGAIDFVPANNTQHVDINVKSGTYSRPISV